MKHKIRQKQLPVIYALQKPNSKFRGVRLPKKTLYFSAVLSGAAESGTARPQLQHNDITPVLQGSCLRYRAVAANRHFDVILLQSQIEE